MSAPYAGTTETSSTACRNLTAASLIIAEETKVVGLTTVEKLNVQEETLRYAEDTLESNEYMVQKAMKTLRGMTWGGMLYNVFVGDPKPRQDGPTTMISSNAVTVDPPTGCAGHAPDLSGSTPPQLLGNRPHVDQEKKDLDQLLASVTQLHDISVTMGRKIEQQHATLDRMENKADQVHDHTLAVTLKASQFTQRSSGAREEFVGYYQFVEDESHALLSVNADGLLVLINTPDRSTLFKCYLKSGTLYALQSDKSLRYVSSTVWGPVRAVSTSFGKREECHITSLSENSPTGIFYPCTNWGAGGWLKHPKEGQFYLDSVTKNMADKENMVMLWPVCLGTTEDVSFTELRSGPDLINRQKGGFL